MMIGFVIMLPLSLLFPKEHPAALSGIGMIIVTIIFWFAMLIPIKMVLQKYINKKIVRRSLPARHQSKLMDVRAGDIQKL